MKAYVLNIAERCENMTTISLRMDDEMKKELDEMCEAMGMNISTFYMVYTKKALRERKIPFEIEAPQDPFYSKTNWNTFGNRLPDQRGEGCGKNDGRTL